MEDNKAKPFALKRLYVLVAVVLVAGIAASLYLITTSSTSGLQTVVSGDNVSVYYTGSLTNGTIFDSNVGKHLFSFIVGSGQVIPGFDQAVLGMKVGQTKNVTLPPSDAYGQVNPALFITVPIAVFGNSSVSVGMHVYSRSTRQQGVVTMVNATNATVDMNSPLAGQTLVFSITLAAINK